MSDNSRRERRKRAKADDAYSPEMIAKALASEQTVFEDAVAEFLPDDEGLVFLTDVADAPVQVGGRLGLDGRWYIGFVFKAPARGVKPELPRGPLVLRDEPVAAAMIRFATRRFC
jgi:hypothetical protein